MQPETTNELATSESMAVQYGTGLSIAQVKWVGQVFYKSGMFQDTGDEAQAMVKIMAGQELGLAPFAAMQGINIIKGRPSMSANLIASAVKKHKLYDYRVVVSTEVHCEIEWFEYIEGKRTKVGKNAFTIEMAKNAQLSFKSDSNWMKYPQAMLFARAISAGQKMYAPDVFMMSVYTEDEILNDTQTGYIPPKATKPTAKAIVANNEPTPGVHIPLDEPFGDTPPVTTEPTAAEGLSNDEAAYDEDSERELAKTSKVVVDAAYKKTVKTTLDALNLGPTERLRLLKESTGRMALEQLTDKEWVKFSNAIDDMMIKKADELTAAETPLKTNGGENETDAKTDQEVATE